MQSRHQSAIEALMGTAIGFVVSIVTGLIVFPLFGHSFTLLDNALITAIYTFVSIVRSYYVRRLFNYLHRVQQ